MAVFAFFFMIGLTMVAFGGVKIAASEMANSVANSSGININSDSEKNTGIILIVIGSLILIPSGFKTIKLIGKYVNMCPQFALAEMIFDA